MLRTIGVRTEVLRNGLKKAANTNVTRCLTTECVRRRHPNRPSVSQYKKVIPKQWTAIQTRYYSSLPSHIKVTLPALSPTMESGSIVSWEKKEGDKLNEGDLLCEIETDKATMGFETPEEGYLAKIIIPTGTKGIPVGKLLCIIVENKEDVAAFKDFKGDDAGAGAAAPAAAPPAVAPPAPAAAPPAPAAAAPAPAAAAPAPAATLSPVSSGSRVFASPMAKKLAELQNKRLQGTGSGIYGSLKSTDIAGLSGAGAGAGAGVGVSAPAAAFAAPAPKPGQAYVDIPHTQMRQTIATRLTQSKQSIPHYQISVTVNVDKVLAVRKQLNERLEKQKAGVKVSVNDFIIKAVASACKRVPDVNASWMEGFVRLYGTVDVSVAVATPTGLITPIVFNADSKGIIEISKNVKDLASRAKEGKLKPEEFQGGTITVSNLGMFDVTHFNAIINPPQSCILACGGLQEQVVIDKTVPEGFRIGNFVTFTTSSDHRVIDGAVGAKWIKAFKDNMEDPVNIIL